MGYFTQRAGIIWDNDLENFTQRPGIILRLWLLDISHNVYNWTGIIWHYNFGEHLWTLLSLFLEILIKNIEEHNHMPLFGDCF